MTSDDHSPLLPAGELVRYLPPEYDPDMHDYANVGDAWIVEVPDGE